MAKILEATCEAGIVKVEGFVIQNAVILSLGGAPSSTGVLIIDGASSYFVASSALDVKTLITNLVQIIQQIVTITTGLDAVTVSPGSNAAGIAALTLLKTQLDLTKDTLI